MNPIKKLVEPPNSVLPTSGSNENARPQVLMLVDDPVLDSLYRSRLQKKEHCIVWCDSPDNWESALIAFQYDIIVFDFSFFHADPIDHLVELMNLSPESDVVILSESEDVRTAVSAFQMGVSEYLLKPADPETLAWAIEKLVRKRVYHSASESLNTDLRIFNVTHQLSASESEDKMRSLVMKHLLPLVAGTGAVWVFPPTKSGAPLNYEFHGRETEIGKGIFEKHF